MKKLLVGLLAFTVVGAASAAPPSPRHHAGPGYHRHYGPAPGYRHHRGPRHGYYRSHGPRHGYYRSHGVRRGTYYFGSNRY